MPNFTESSPVPAAIFHEQGSMDLHIIWSLHARCNFRCTYCPDRNSQGDFAWLKEKELYRFTEDLLAHYRKNLGKKNIQISFTGGEPTLWPGFLDYCQWLRNQNVFLNLSSNGSLPVSYWERLAPLLGYICLSYHPQQVRDDRFLAVLRHIHDRKDTSLPQVRLMMCADADLWQKSINLAQELEQRFTNFHYEFVAIQPDFGEDIEAQAYSDEQMQFLQAARVQSRYRQMDLIRRDHIVPIRCKTQFDDGSIAYTVMNDLINRNQNRFQGWSCAAGLESLFINDNGDLYRAGCFEGGRLGNIMELDSVHFPRQPVTCSLSDCICTANIMIPKQRLNDQVMATPAQRRIFDMAAAGDARDQKSAP